MMNMKPIRLTVVYWTLKLMANLTIGTTSEPHTVVSTKHILQHTTL